MAATKKSGKSISTAIDQVTEILGPWLRGNKKIDCNTVRRTIEPYVQNGVVLSDVAIRSILKGVTDRMAKGDYKVPKPIISQEMLRAYMSIDYSSKNCGKILEDILKNANTNGENSWIVLRLMDRLKAEDPYFDYRVHTDQNDHIDCVTWQIGVSRAALSRYGDKVFLDTRNNENMNCIGMQYMSFIVIDGNKQMIPASESFVFTESEELYDTVVNFTIQMSPNFSPESTLLGFGDMFISPEVARKWFPNIIWLCDTYHFCSKKKKDNVLAKSFGPKYWAIVADEMIAAVYAKTEEKCLVS